MKWFVIGAMALLPACSARSHSFVVEVEDAAKPVTKAEVIICEKPPEPLKQTGKWFVGRVAACEGSGVVRLTHADGTTTDCRVGYVTTMDDWWMFEVRGQVCDLDWDKKPQSA